jgi:hypothetical protein
MLKEAVKLTTEGQRVYVLAAHESHRRALIWELRRISPSALSTAALTFVTPRSADFDWRDLTIRGVDPRTTTILIDHYAIEHRFPRLIEMYRRFDLGQTEEGEEEA